MCVQTAQCHPSPGCDQSVLSLSPSRAILCVFFLITSRVQQQDPSKGWQFKSGARLDASSVAKSLPDLHRGTVGIKAPWKPALAVLGMGGADLECPKSVPCSHQAIPTSLHVLEPKSQCCGLALLGCSALVLNRNRAEQKQTAAAVFSLNSCN